MLVPSRRATADDGYVPVRGRLGRWRGWRRSEIVDEYGYRDDGDPDEREHEIGDEQRALRAAVAKPDVEDLDRFMWKLDSRYEKRVTPDGGVEILAKGAVGHRAARLA